MVEFDKMCVTMAFDELAALSTEQASDLINRVFLDGTDSAISLSPTDEHPAGSTSYFPTPPSVFEQTYLPMPAVLKKAYSAATYPIRLAGAIKNIAQASVANAMSGSVGIVKGGIQCGVTTASACTPQYVHSCVAYGYEVTAEIAADTVEYAVQKRARATASAVVGVETIQAKFETGCKMVGGMTSTASGYVPSFIKTRVIGLGKFFFGA